MNRLYALRYSSPLGRLALVSNGSALVGIYFDEPPRTHAQLLSDRGPFCTATEQLDRYFQRDLTRFDLPIELVGTDFQQSVWRALRQIPFGATVTYAELAERLGKPKAIRAVGAANGRNPLSIVVPCHRVVGARGKLTGYAGGLDRKAWLLRHESGHLAASASRKRASRRDAASPE